MMNKMRIGISFATILTLSISGSSMATANVSPQRYKYSISVEKEEKIMKPLSFVKPKVVKKQLSPLELKAVLHEAGFRGQNLVEAWGTAMKESTGRPFAHNKNSNTGDNSYGLFQINMIGSLGPARRDQYNLKNNKDLFDPLTNAKIAFHMSNGGKDWSAWHGITDKTKQFMSEFPR